MCHIIYEIILYLGQLLLTEDDIDSKMNVTSNTNVKISDGIINLTELNM